MVAWGLSELQLKALRDACGVLVPRLQDFSDGGLWALRVAALKDLHDDGLGSFGVVARSFERWWLGNFRQKVFAWTTLTINKIWSFLQLLL